jgi:hypothetical protein
LGDKKRIDGHKERIELIKVNDCGTGNRLFIFTQVTGTAIYLPLTPFSKDNRETMRAADDRTGGIQQTAMIFQQGAAFSTGVLCHVLPDGGSLFFRQGFKGGIQSRRLHGKQGYCRTATAAPLTAGELAGKQILYFPAKGIHTGYHPVIIIKQIIHDQQVSQIGTLLKWVCLNKQ